LDPTLMLKADAIVKKVFTDVGRLPYIELTDRTTAITPNYKL
jgi:hypothetical protein